MLTEDEALEAVQSALGDQPVTKELVKQLVGRLFTAYIQQQHPEQLINAATDGDAAQSRANPMPDELVQLLFHLQGFSAERVGKVRPTWPCTSYR